MVQRVLVVTAVLASLLEIIDSAIVNVAVPTMMGNLGTTLEDISWVVTGYIIANAIVLPLAGWLGMRIGRRTYYTGCILIFTAASVGCGFAPNLTTLILFRVVQGLAGGALLPTSQSLIMEAFPREKAGMASAIYGMSVMIGPTIGPTLGGYLTDNFGWRSIFNINLPLGLLAAFLSYMYVKNPEETPAQKEVMKRAKVDTIGLMLLVLGIGCLQFVLERGEADDWFDSKAILISAIVAVLALPSFVWWELKTDHPIVDLRMFKHAAVRYGTLIMATVGSMLYSLIFFIPVFCSSIMGLTATQTGELFIPGALASAFLMPLIGKQLRTRDPRILMATGIVIFVGAVVAISRFTSLTSTDDMFFPLLFRGAAMAFLFVPINASVLGQFTGRELGQAAGLMNLSRQIGGSVGIAVFSTLLSHFRAQERTDLASSVSLLNPVSSEQFNALKAALAAKAAGAMGMAQSAEAALKLLYARVERQAFVLSFEKTMLVLAVTSSLALIPIYFLRIKHKITGPVDAH